MKGFVVAALLLLAGCNGGGEGNDASDLMKLLTDPRVIRLGAIVERADDLLVPAVHVNYSVSIPGDTTTESPFQEVSCDGVACTGEGVTLSLTDLIDPGINIPASEANLQSHADGFDTISFKANLDVLNVEALLPGVTVTVIPEAYGYGFWGEHGIAGLAVANGPFSGRSINIPFDGDMNLTIPFVIGDVSGTNPDGVGGATWTGIAEAVSTRTFMPREGTATLTVPDLSQPTVNVGIDISGNPIGAPGWTGLSLDDGHFVTGDVGLDYLEGNFYGAEHSEAYGVFDTETFIGVFGAKRGQEDAHAVPDPELVDPIDEEPAPDPELVEPLT